MCSKQLVFLHIPKTGGITFGNALERMFSGPKTKVINFHTDPRLSGEIDRAKIYSYTKEKLKSDSFDFATGHIQFVHLPNTTWIAILREPVSRIISWYHYMRKNLQRIPKEKQHPFLLDVDEFIGCFEAFWPGASTEQIDSLEPERDISKAISKIESGEIQIGFFEDYERSVTSICQAQNLPLPFYHRKVNIGRYAKPPESTLSKLATKLSLEIDFYNEIKSKFGIDQTSVVPNLNQPLVYLNYLKKSSLKYCAQHYDNLICWGASQGFIEFLGALGPNKTQIQVVDADPEKWGKTILGYKIQPPEILKQGAEMVVITSCHRSEIHQSLTSYEIAEISFPNYDESGA